MAAALGPPLREPRRHLSAFFPFRPRPDLGARRVASPGWRTPPRQTIDEPSRSLCAGTSLLYDLGEHGSRNVMPRRSA